jgi:hypothetical protein
MGPGAPGSCMADLAMQPMLGASFSRETHAGARAADGKEGRGRPGAYQRRRWWSTATSGRSGGASGPFRARSGAGSVAASPAVASPGRLRSKCPRTAMAELPSETQRTSTRTWRRRGQG